MNKDELRKKVSEIIRYNGFNLSNDEAIEAVLALIAAQDVESHRDELESLPQPSCECGLCVEVTDRLAALDKQAKEQTHEI